MRVWSDIGYMRVWSDTVHVYMRVWSDNIGYMRGVVRYSACVHEGVVR